MSLKAVFFDIDGTLVDSNEFHVKAWQEAFSDHGYQVAMDSIRAHIGEGADHLIPSLLPDLSGLIRDSMTNCHAAIFAARNLKQGIPFPHATDLVELVHDKGKHVELASSEGKSG